LSITQVVNSLAFGCPTLIDSHGRLSSPLLWAGSHFDDSSVRQINYNATLVFVWQRHQSWENSHANSRFSTALINWLMQLLLFSFDSGMRVMTETLTQTLASQWLSLTLMQLYSCSRLTAAWELRKLSCKLSLLNWLILVWPGLIYIPSLDFYDKHAEYKTCWLEQPPARILFFFYPFTHSWSIACSLSNRT
jgi:hypothetical protein